MPKKIAIEVEIWEEWANDIAEHWCMVSVVYTDGSAKHRVQGGFESHYDVLCNVPILIGEILCG